MGRGFTLDNCDPRTWWSVSSKTLPSGLGIPLPLLLRLGFPRKLGPTHFPPALGPQCRERATRGPRFPYPLSGPLQCLWDPEDEHGWGAWPTPRPPPVPLPGSASHWEPCVDSSQYPAPRSHCSGLAARGPVLGVLSGGQAGHRGRGWPQHALRQGIWGPGWPECGLKEGCGLWVGLSL